MFVAGLRFDTSGRGRAGTRWQAAPAAPRASPSGTSPGSSYSSSDGTSSSSSSRPCLSSRTGTFVPISSATITR